MNDTKEQTRKWTLDLGKVDYGGRGRKANRVTLDVELRHKVNDVAPYLDVELTPCREYTEFSITGAIWNAAGSDHLSSGQNVDQIRKLFPTGPVARLVEIWSRYHLNGMKAGTRLQETYLQKNPPVGSADPYGAACAALHKAGILTVSGPGNRNYKYGSAWLVERLPAEVEAEIVSLCGELTGERQAEPAEPKDFAEEHGISATAELTDSNPNMEDKRGDMDHWRVTLRRGRARMTLVFSKGSGHHGKEPSTMEVLGCLASDSKSADYSFADWCSEFGYDTDSRKAEKTYNTVKKQAEKLKRFLGDGLYSALLSDSQG